MALPAGDYGALDMMDRADFPPAMYLDVYLLLTATPAVMPSYAKRENEWILSYVVTPHPFGLAASGAPGDICVPGRNVRTLVSSRYSLPYTVRGGEVYSSLGGRAVMSGLTNTPGTDWWFNYARAV